jgi:hypothetical protein
MQKEKGFWIGLSLINLTVVALFGLLMRSKIIFSIPFLDYRNLLNAHSYFALSGWLGLSFVAFLIFDILPSPLSQKRFYRTVLWAFQISAAGMGLSFPFGGYHPVSVFFVVLYFAISFVFGWVFFGDLKKAPLMPVVRWLSIGAVASLLLSTTLPLGLAYITLTKSGNSLLYRDLAYTFLHLQYNGFFTLAVFAIFFSWCNKQNITLPSAAKKFSFYLLFSVLPSSFLALLWHSITIFYLMAALGGLLILASIAYFIPILRSSLKHHLFQHPLAKFLWIASFISFVLKMVLTTGTLDPSLGKAVYAARPIIIGFMHLIFLAFASFFILSICLEQGYFSNRKGLVSYPFYLFGAGVLVTELLLMTQGLAVLFQWNHPLFNTGLWAGAILLFVGACTITATFYRVRKESDRII